MEMLSKEILLPFTSLAILVVIVVSIILFLKACTSGSRRHQRVRYVLLNAKREFRGLKEHLYSSAGLSESDDVVFFKNNKVIIKAKNKLTNQQWKDCEQFRNHRLILVQQIANAELEISENFADELRNVDTDGLKIKYVSRHDKANGETQRQQKYRRILIQGDWLNISLFLDRLTEPNYLVKEQELGSYSLAVDDEMDRPLLQHSFKQKKTKKEQKNNFVREDFENVHCEKQTGTLNIEHQLYNYATELCEEDLHCMITPKPIDYSYKGDLLALTGQACMVSKAIENLQVFFEKLTVDLSEFTYTLPEGISVDAFKTKADLQIAAPMKTLMLQHGRNSFRVLGPKDKLSQVRDMLTVLRNEFSSSLNPMQPGQSSGFIHPAESKRMGNHDRFVNQPFQSNYIDAGNLGSPEDNEIPPMNFQKNRIQVSVIKGDLTKQNTDVIVNPTNESLQLGGGAAKAIANAAGHQLLHECRRYIERYGRLNVGQVMHTTAGNLCPQIKYVIHAAGPSAHKYPDEKTQEKVVEETFFNCFKHANDHLKAVSISIPAISSGILGIHKDLVARSASHALTRFEKGGSSGKRTLEKVNFVNIDDESTEVFQNVFRGKQPSMTRTKPVENNEHEKEPKRSSNDSGQSKRTRVLKHDSSVPDQSAEKCDVYKSSKKICKNVDSSDDSIDSEDCVICMESITDPETLPCGHKFCKSCIKSSFEMFQPKCPSCGRLFGMMRGNQPRGTMTVSTSPRSLTGYETCKTIVIQYDIPSGIQDERHPNPGQSYHGTQRTAYLPDNAQGQEVVKLLRRAFDASLIFTVGRSSTTGRDNQVIWNDIHHKTSEIGPYGYPDPQYLSRVKEELKAKGIISASNGISVRQTAI